MAHYVYEGQHFELPDGLSNEAAIAKIETHLGKKPKAVPQTAGEYFDKAPAGVKFAAGIPEAAISMLSGLPSQIAGGLYGLGTLLSGQGLDKAASASQRIQEENFGFGAYTGSTGPGKYATEKTMEAFQVPGEKAGDVGAYIGKHLGNEELGRLSAKLPVDVALNFLPLHLGVVKPIQGVNKLLEKANTPKMGKDYSSLVEQETAKLPVTPEIQVPELRLEHPIAAETRVREMNRKQPSAEDYANRDANVRVVEEEIAAMEAYQKQQAEEAAALQAQEQQQIADVFRPLTTAPEKAMSPSQLRQWKETQDRFAAYHEEQQRLARQGLAQDTIQARQKALEEQVRRQTTLDMNAAQRARQEQAPAGYADWVANKALEEGKQTQEFVSQLKQDEIDATPYGERPAQYGFTDEGGRVDENGIPIRADLSMEAQNLQNPLQRNLWGDELGPAQGAEKSLTEALDSLVDTPFRGDARDVALQQLQGSTEPSKGLLGAMEQANTSASGSADLRPMSRQGQRGAVDFQTILDYFPHFSGTKITSPLYHGTTHEVKDGLKAGKDGGALGNGIYLAVRPEYASGYAEDRGGNVHQVYANIKNPLVIDGPGDPMVNALVTLGKTKEQANKIVEKAYDDKGYITTEVQNLAKKQGYDGIFQKRNGQLSEIVAFHPEQIKSAISPSYKKGQRGAIDLGNNASGESPASLEALGRLAEERQLGRVRAVVKQDGTTTPLIGVDAVDYRPRPGEVVVQKNIGNTPWTILDSNGVKNPQAQLNRGLSRGQRGAVDFGSNKQLPSTEELSLLPKGARTFVDSVETPRSPETIAARNELGEKAAAANIRGTSYDRVTTPEQVVASLDSAPKDIRLSYTGVRNKNISGVESLLRLYPQNKFLNYVRSSVQDARNLAENWSQEYLTGKTGINNLLNKLSIEEKGDVVGLLLALDKKQQPLTDSIMNAAEFTASQKAVAVRMREAFDHLYAEKAKALGSQGFDPHMYRQGYVPANFAGAYKTLVGFTSKDGKFHVTGIAQADTVYGHKKAVEWYKKQGGDKYTTFIPMEREGYRTSSLRGSKAEAWSTLVNQLAKHDPEFAEVKRIADQVGAEAAHKLYDFQVHEKRKAGVTGSLGDRPWLDKKQNTQQFIEGMVDYLEEGFRYTAYQEPINNIHKLLTNPKVQESLPNTAAYVNQYVNHLTGNNLHPVGAALNWGVDTIARALTVGNTKINKFQNELSHWSSVHMMGMVNAGFFLMQTTQVLTGGMPEAVALRNTLQSNPTTLANSMKNVTASLPLLALENQTGKTYPVAQHMRDAYDWAHKAGMFSFSEAELAHQVLQSKTRKFVDKAATMPIRYGELTTRPTIFMMFVDMLHQEGITGEQGRLVAQNATDFAMANYHPDERPMLYQSLGVVGSLAGALSTYKHNILSQMAVRGKEAVKQPMALATMVGLGYALYGLSGVPGAQEASSIAEMVTDKPLRELLLTNPRESSSWYDGVLSASSGLDFQSRLSMSSVLPDSPLSTFPHISNIITVMDKALSAAKNQDTGSFQDLALAGTPAGMRGMTEKALFPDGNILDKESQTKYEQPRTEQEQKTRIIFGIRPLRERMQDERIYATRVSEAKRAKDLTEAQKLFDRAFLLNDGKTQDKAYEKYIEAGGDPRTIWNAQRLKTLVEQAGMTEEQRRAGKPGNNLNKLRQYEAYTQ